MTNEELSQLFQQHSADWKAGFFFAVNLTNESKAAFLRLMVGQPVQVTEASHGQETTSSRSEET